MHKSWVQAAQNLVKTCVKNPYLYSLRAPKIRLVEKQHSFTTSSSRFFPALFHRFFSFFQSVNYQFLPIIHTTYKYNNDIKLTNNYWKELI